VKVAVDEQVFVRLRRGGIARAFVELLRALPSVDDHVAARLDARYVVNEHAVEAGLAHRFPPALGQRRRLLTAANATYRWLHRESGPDDVRHLTLYDPAYLPRPGSGTLAVVTVHDMIPELYPEQFAGREGLHDGKRECVERADLVICVSRSTRDDLLRMYGPLRAPVVVVPLGVSPGFGAGTTSPAPSGRPDSYLLHVGERGGYKDFATTLRAVAALSADRPGLHVVAVGGGPWTPEEAALVERLRLGSRVHRIEASDAEMPAVYAAATCLVVPSRYEGFGLPVLEAMAAGCPVVSSDASSLPEVGAAAASYFPAGDPAGLADRLADITSDDDVAEQLRLLGRARAAELTWERTASATVAAYREALAALAGGAVPSGRGTA
jgi:glycosyltransferase involved in cell wall biosynthesis